MVIQWQETDCIFLTSGGLKPYIWLILILVLMLVVVLLMLFLILWRVKRRRKRYAHITVQLEFSPPVLIGEILSEYFLLC